MLWTLSTTLPISPILKIPILFANTVLTHAAFTPPQPPADPDEIAKYEHDKSEPSRLALLRILAQMAKTVHWTYAIVESTAILAQAYNTPEREDILSRLVLGQHSASNIRFTPSWLLGCTLMCVGPMIRIACHRELGKFFTWELSVKKDHQLVTTGPYAVVRHPSYTGMALGATGSLLCHLGPGTWALECGWLDTVGGKVTAAIWLAYLTFVPIMLIARVKSEDRVLKAQFPEEWAAWAKRTPYRLIPYIF